MRSTCERLLHKYTRGSWLSLLTSILNLRTIGKATVLYLVVTTDLEILQFCLRNVYGPRKRTVFNGNGIGDSNKAMASGGGRGRASGVSSGRGCGSVIDDRVNGCVIGAAQSIAHRRAVRISHPCSNQAWASGRAS